MSNSVPNERPATQGPGRPPGPDGRGRAIRIYAPASVISALDDEARRRGQSRSSAIVDAVKIWLSRRSPVFEPHAPSLVGIGWGAPSVQVTSHVDRTVEIGERVKAPQFEEI